MQVLYVQLCLEHLGFFSHMFVRECGTSGHLDGPCSCCLGGDIQGSLNKGTLKSTISFQIHVQCCYKYKTG